MTTADKIANALRPVAPGGKLTAEDVPWINELALLWDRRTPQGKKTGPKGIALIKEFEGLRLLAYPDPATGGEPWTIGYGHTKGVRKNDEITAAQADGFLRVDLLECERAVSRLCPTTTQEQFDALVSFCFNLGEGNLESSTLRRLHNEGNYAGAKAQFVRWNKANGKVMSGLTRRREAEASLYGSGT